MKAARSLTALCLAGCVLAAQARPIRVATLNTVLTEIAREVGGSEVDVIGLVQPGADPHTFNPSPADMRTLADADIVLASGLNIESYVDRLLSSAVTKGRVVAVGDALPAALSMPAPGGGGEKDPHWWHSVDNMLFAATLVSRELSRERPSSAESFGLSAEAYRRRLLALRAWVSSEVAGLPPSRRHLVTSHDAFGYFARDYGFTVHSINGLSTESEVDAKHLARLVDLIRREKIRAIFAESSANPRLVENLLEETGAHLGGTLYADGLGPEGSDAGTYEAMFRHNASAIVSSLSEP
jgi:zinc/manganese transport system substrate-binding protein